MIILGALTTEGVNNGTPMFSPIKISPKPEHSVLQAYVTSNVAQSIWLGSDCKGDNNLRQKYWN